MNGWSNQETWRAWTELTNSELTYSALQIIKNRNLHNLQDFALELENCFGSAYKNANWNEIAKHLLDEEPKNVQT